MTDIVERLRWSMVSIDYEAADEIERLRAERDRLRDALKRKQAMTDIVERLRFMGDNEPGCDPSITEEAAAEIERLRDALNKIGGIINEMAAITLKGSGRD